MYAEIVEVFISDSFTYVFSVEMKKIYIYIGLGIIQFSFTAN